MKDKFPSIDDSGITHWDIPNETLIGSGGERFNGCLFEWRGETLMSYRAYSPDHGRTVIAISRLDNNWNATDKTILSLPGKGSQQITEDARLFASQGELYCSYTEIDHSVNPAWHATMRLVRLNEDFTVDKFIPMTFGNNKDYAGIEKNWVFFEDGENLKFIYDISKMHVCQIHPQSGQVKAQWESNKIYYEHGLIRGGSSPTKYSDDEMIAFYHTSTDFPWLERRYGMGVFTFDPKEPHKMKRISKVPLLMGSRNNPFCGSGNGKCIFPCGHIVKNDDFYVACGVNDTYNTILKFTVEQLEENLVPASTYHKKPVKYFFSNKQGNVPGTHKDHPWIMIRVGQKRESVIMLDDMKALSYVKEDPSIREITLDEYNSYLAQIGRSPKQDDGQGNLFQATTINIQELRRNGELIG